MMKKKEYNRPLMDIVMLKQQQALLTGSYSGPANSPEATFGVDDMDIFGSDEVTFSDDDLVHFSD